MDERVNVSTAPDPAALQAADWVLRSLGGHRQPPGEQERIRLASRLEQRLLRPGTVAVLRGTMPEGVWIVRSGTLELVAGSGRGRVVVGVLQPGDAVGDVPLLLGQPAVCTARALTDVQAGFLPAARFSVLLEENPRLARCWLTGLARRHARAHEALAQTVGGSAQGRTAGLLLREARGGTVACSQDTLAAMVGLRRPTLNRVLKEFEREGLLRVGYRQIELLAEDGLRRRARGAG